MCSQEASWKAEKERLCRDKMALQRECRQLLERLQELQGLVRQFCPSYRPLLLVRAPEHLRLALHCLYADCVPSIAVVKVTAKFMRADRL